MSRLRTGRAARAAERDRDEHDVPVLVDWSRMPDEEMLRAQLRDAVAAAIAELPEIYRAPVVLRDIQGLSTEEASSRLNVKDQTLKSRLHRGRIMLRERLRAFATGVTLHRPTPAYS
jgi:RNA polymerase sigma-70 factor (ECF subfamily)